jgi:Cdc6-like AAA superfamily ATPase
MSESEPQQRVSRDDLIQVEYELYSAMLQQQRRELRKNFDHRVAEHLGTDGSGWLTVAEQYEPPLDEAIALVLGAQLRRHASDIGGATLSEPAGWKRVTVGEALERAADYVTGFCDSGTLLDVPVVVSTWTHQAHRHVRVVVRTEHEEAAHEYLKALEESARGESNPWRLQLLDATAVAGGIKFETRPLSSLDPGPLWFPSEVSDVISDNVIDAVQRLSALRGAGLGSNRGILIVGPPGVGKTALCRRAALELHGRATIVLVSAQVGQWLIARLYDELQYLAPAVVFLEDLDLLVGDREDRSARQGLMDFLTVLDGLMTRHHEVVTVATSNDPDAIDAAAVRAGRFDLTLEMGPPDEEARREILRHFLQQLELQDSIDYDRLVRSTEDATGADLREIIRRAFLAAKGSGITTDDLLAAADAIPFRSPTSNGRAPDPGHPPTTGRYL